VSRRQHYALGPSCIVGLLVSGIALGATVEERLAQYGARARERLARHFAAASVRYPPSRLTLLALKQERSLELYARDAHGAQRFVHSYPVLAASGTLGPKLRMGDEQVPEGLYRVELLNPNSRFHLSLRLSYPNAFDRRMARADGRTHLGGDIMIHGNRVSIGCLAMGDVAAEDLFVMAADTGLQRIDVILAPLDLRSERPPAGPQLPSWAPILYREIAAAMAELPRPLRASR
jgi:hypothetical protein